MLNQDNDDHIKKVLGEPYPVELSDQAYKIRRNLLSVSSIVLIMHFLGISLADENITFFSLTLKGIKSNTIYIILLSLTVYFSFYFLWTILESVIYWILRLTGTRNLYSGGFYYHTQDVGDEKQTTLYKWWLTNKRDTNKIYDDIKEIKILLETKKQESLKEINELSRKLDTISNSVSDLNNFFQNDRFCCAIRRFDCTFKYFIYSQSIKRLIIEAFFPLAMGLFSTCILIYKIFFQ